MSENVLTFLQRNVSGDHLTIRPLPNEHETSFGWAVLDALGAKKKFLLIFKGLYPLGTNMSKL